MKIHRNILLLFFTSLQLIGVSQNDSVQVSIFPNPSDSVITISINLEDSAVLNFELIDLLGHTIYELNEKNLSESTQFSTLLDSLKKGIYFSRIELNEQQVVNKLVFKGDLTWAILKFEINILPDLTESDKIKIFPNPILHEDLHFETRSESNQVSYFIFNMQGQLVYKKDVVTQQGYASLSFSISDWKSGQYIVKMKSESGEAESTFIKIEE